MGKIELIMQGRDEGLDMALRIVKQGGVEALEKEIEFRRLRGLNTKLTMAEYKAFERKIRHEYALAFIPMVLLTLHDQFGFGKKRCHEFSERFKMKIDGLVDSDSGVDYRDYLQVVKDEIGLELNYNG
jgi:hypothetical protein